VIIREIVKLMKDVYDGGWQEANAALRRLKAMETAYGLPALN
jgi:hypothetical protein